ncbi:MAG: hypothetical protein JO050_10600 [Acidimicrobiia bacterium]|nr:hypothetical protein [Acidimicrobiia bacterium]
MAAPEYVPVSLNELPRLKEPIPPPGHWTADRPADLRAAGRPLGPKFGRPGPDQGYALTLAHRFEERLQLAEGEHAEDVVAGCVGVATKRSSLFGRAPVIYDLELAFTLWGFLATPPEYLAEFRRPLFEGVRHHYWDQRKISDMVPDETLRLTPQQVRERLPNWRSLLNI